MSLINHQDNYRISHLDFIANALTVSGVSYSKRHFEMVKMTQGREAAAHVALGILELLPVIGAIIAIFERIIVSAWQKGQPIPAPNPQLPPSPPPPPQPALQLQPQFIPLPQSPSLPRPPQLISIDVNPDDKGKEELDANPINNINNNNNLNESEHIPDETPGGLGLAWNHWGNLRKIAQVVTGNFTPIIDFILESMSEEIQASFQKVIKNFKDLLFDLEKNPRDDETVLSSYQLFQIAQDWSFATGSEGASAIRKYQVFFWFYAAYLIEQDIQTRRDPKAISQLQKLSALTIRQAQDLLWEKVKTPHKIAKVEVGRKMGGISTQEHDWIQKRLQKVLESQKKLFNDDSLTEPLRIGLCLSGGGFRATTLAAGYMTALHKLGIVDSSLYVSGLSGSTWFLVSWLLSGNNPEESKKMLQKIFPKANVPSFLKNLDKLDIPRFLHDVILPKAINGKPISSVDFYGGLLARALLMNNHGDRRHELTMHDIAECIEGADCPFPIFTAISETDVGTNGNKWYNWFEFNPYEVENDTLGLSIPACAFGSKFENGIAAILSEETIGSLMAMWGSAYTVDLSNQIDEKLVGGSIIRTITHAIARLVMPTGLYNEGRVSPAQSFNPLYKLPLERCAERFESQQVADAVTKKEKWTYNDAGIDFNLPLIPLLKRMRDLDVVFVGDASSGEITKEHPMPDGITTCPEELAKFFKDVHRYGISYKRMDPNSPLNFSVYIPEYPDNKHEPIWIEGEKLPILVYFNFNTDKQMIERFKDDDELGPTIRDNNLENFDAVKSLNGYANTFNFEYKSKEFAQLAAVGEFNILSHQEDIMQILKKVLKQKSDC